MSDGSVENLDEKACLLEIEQGDEDSFTQLFRKYRNPLFTYLFRITKSKEVAEEFVLDLFLKLWQGRDRASQIENLKAYLFQAARNKAVDFFRLAKNDPVRRQELSALLSEARSHEAADSKLLKQGLDDALHAAVEHLSSQRQKIYQLRYNAGLSYAEIALQMNLSHHTVRNQLAASMLFIRKYLVKNGFLVIIWIFYK